MVRKRRLDPRVQLAASVLVGETTEFPWAVLRSTYFTAKSDSAAARDLVLWGDEYGIGVMLEHREPPHERWILFSVPYLR